MGNLTDEGFEVVLSSDSRFEQMTAEIFFNGRFVALISQEEGPSKLLLEFPGPDIEEERIVRVVAMNDFLVALETARSRLLEG